MNFDDLQKAWQSQSPGAKPNPEALLLEVQRQHQQFTRTIFWRDVREVSVAFLLAIYFAFGGLRQQDGLLLLIALACLGVGTFFLVDRRVQRKKEPIKNDTVKSCAEHALFQVQHQIWLLKNILWWYLLPIGLPLAVFFLSPVWRTGFNFERVFASGSLLIFLVALYYFIYWLNQKAVRNELEPREQALQALLSSLE